MGLLDYKEIKKDFPLLSRDMNGKRLAFLDSAASSQMPDSVIDAYGSYYRNHHANIHRGAYIISYEATDLYDAARARTAKFLGAKRPETVIFTRNTTESINLVASSWGEMHIQEGDEILLSELEHHSNLVPWMMLAKRKNAIIKHIPLTDDFRLDLSRIDDVLTSRTRMVAVAHSSNAIGTIHDLKTIGEKARSVGAAFLVDGAQGAPHLPVRVQEIDCDFYALSAHKMLGPTGVGVLYGKKEILEEIPPFLGGGDMILSVSRDDFKPAGLPEKFEAGTPNIAGVISFVKAIEYLENVGIEKIHDHEEGLLSMAIDELSSLSGITLYGPRELSQRSGVLSITVDGVHPHDVGSILDSEGVAVRAGHHCCEPFMKRLELPGTVRASFYIYNGPEDVESLVHGIKKVKEVFARVTQR